ncbi:hypothetical protein AB0M95_27690 [Sphaerisporangium sp. NPDC051017]|uniref:hypothetical protein n=1 Tax=Sphaerisporangium sp. NPDC051017 TaxID=3154636 RepID=UPI00344871A4
MHIDSSVERNYAGFFDEHGVTAILYRPGFYIFGSAAKPEDVGPLIADLATRFPAGIRPADEAAGVAAR